MRLTLPALLAGLLLAGCDRPAAQPKQAAAPPQAPQVVHPRER